MSIDNRAFRNRSRRLVIELAVVVLLAGFPIDFPRATSAGDAWSFLFRQPSLLLHAVIGAGAVTEAVIFVARAITSHRPGLRVVASLGLLFTLVAFGAGVGYVGGGQDDLPLTLMTLGWIAAVVTYTAGWILGRRGIRAERQTAAAG